METNSVGAGSQARSFDAAFLALLRAADAERGRSLAVVERTGRQGETTPLHVHPEDEIVHVVDGVLTLFVDDALVRLGAGDAFTAPRATPHAVRVESQEVRYVSANARAFRGALRGFPPCGRPPGGGTAIVLGGERRRLAARGDCGAERNPGARGPGGLPADLLDLLLVVLDDRLRAGTRAIRVEPELLLPAPLPKQVPAAVELDLDFFQPPAIVVCRLVSRFGLPQAVLLLHQFLDAVPDDRVARHAGFLLVGFMS
jgi:quercetin dioxygenase-like cupin family protein